jgi:2-amino-4-hydroxy-6-hydroxymethyldihydropteridine diphosphokinase
LVGITTFSAVPVAIALGSNLGDRRAHLEWAIDRLRLYLSDVQGSSFIETEPVGVDEPQPPYLNAVAVGKTRLSPRELLDTLLEMEHERGRRRTTPRAPRTLDLDLILYGDLVAEAPGLTVPHPRFHEREFVLVPLVEVAPDMREPVTGMTAMELLRALRARG